MPAYRPLCRADALSPGAARLFVVDGKEIALFRVGDHFHATEETCLHAGGPLHEGHLEGTTLTCPWHQWQFDVATGACALNPLQRLATYPVRVRDGVVEVEV